MTGELEVRSARQEIADREYDGIGSLGGALADRQRMAATVEAAKRANMDAREWMWTAREAERTLGRMIESARQAGDLAEQGGAPHDHPTSSVSTLGDLGISRDLAAYAVSLSRLPGDAWDQMRGQDGPEPTRSAVADAVRKYWDAVGDLEDATEKAAKRAEELRRQADDIESAAREYDARPSVPPLAAEEMSTRGFEIALAVAAGAADDSPKLDTRREVRAQDTLLSSIGTLADRIACHDPVIREDMMREADVMAARTAVRRLVEASTVWLRTLNELYKDTREDQ
jgi:hypothetical protein